MTHSRSHAFASTRSNCIFWALLGGWLGGGCGDQTPGQDGTETDGSHDASSEATSASTLDDGSDAPTLCGNGVVDEGEDCDDGPCCTADCLFAAVGTECRPASDPCDAPETCSGHSAHCPADGRLATDEPVILPAVSMGQGGTYPRATPLDDGALLGVYEAHEGATDQLVLRSVRSTDRALSWTSLGTIASEPATPGRSLANVQALQLPTGTVLASFRHHDPGHNVVNYRLLVSASNDFGATWTFRGEIEVFTSAVVGIWEPFLFFTPGGRLQAYYAKEKSDGFQDVVLRESSDEGATWSGERLVARLNGSRDGMPGVTTLVDGSLLAVFESFRAPGTNTRFVVRAVQSNDDGVLWQHRHDVWLPSNAARNAGAPQVVTLEDGRAVSVFMTDDASPSSSWPGGADVAIVVSENVPTFGDVTWSPDPIVVAKASAFWPGLVQAPLRDPVVLFADGGVKSAHVCLPPANQ